MNKTTQLGLVVLFSACSFFSTFSAANAQSRWGGDRAARVITETLGFESKVTRVDAVGYAEALRSVTLYPAVSEEVMTVNFKPGDRVQAGAVLVQLDDRRQQAELDRAKIQLADAERTVKRLQQSRSQGAVAQSELDAAITSRDLFKVAVEQAEVEVAFRRITAPFSGVVGFTEIEPGDRVTTTTMITSIDKREQLYVRFDAPEVALPLLQQGASIEVRPWNQQSLAYVASIEQIDSRIDVNTRTIAVRAVVDNSDDQLRPGMSFRVSLTLRGDRFAVIPEAALMWGAEGAYIWLNRDGKATRVDVSIEQRLAGRILVNGELQLGEELIVEGVQQLRPGQSVQVANGAGIE